jgi:hypothetical protein
MRAEVNASITRLRGDLQLSLPTLRASHKIPLVPRKQDHGNLASKSAECLISEARGRCVAFDQSNCNEMCNCPSIKRWTFEDDILTVRLYAKPLKDSGGERGIDRRGLALTLLPAEFCSRAVLDSET